MIRITDKDTIEVMFADGERTATASISLTKLKELIMNDDPINEDMECIGVYLSVGI